MHFKRLEIQGYKAFATRTVFDIDPGITAVVGPNGSGKSNIMDALRWVMGETANRHMRANRLEEVIFTGSQQRAPTGMAEVRVVLNNDGGWLPLDPGEVSVTRRVHRSGDSEFLINDKPVRLREIQQLFSRGGLGAGSYALMGQGLVEEVLRLKPEERRGLIEEVADVRRHRRQMEEARRRRQESHENLGKRVRLLVEEIEPRRRTLERQAKRALQHADLTAELRAALRRFYGQEWRRLQAELAARAGARTGSRVARDRVAQEVADAEAALAAWNSAISEARAVQERAEEERRRRGARLRELEHERALARQGDELLQRRLEELRSDVAALTEEAESAGALAAPDPGEADVAVRDQALAAARDAHQRAQTALDAIDGEQAALRRRKAEADERLRRLAVVAAEEEQRLKAVEDERSALSAAANERTERMTPLRRRLEAAAVAAGEAAARLAASGPDANAAGERRDELAQRLYGAGARLRDLEASRAERERRLTRARDRLQMLKELQAESEGMQQGLRALFGSRGVPHAGEPTGIPGVVGVIRHLVRAPQGLEQAIEAALQDYLDAVIFESATDAVGTMEALIAERAGRLVALPLDEIRSRSPLVLPPEPRVIGVAARLVKCHHRYRDLVNTLLGRTIVVEDIDTARALLKRGLGAVVTRDGHLLRPNGAITGGRIAEAGTFTRENELQSLPAQIEQLERDLAESAAVAEPRAELERLERELQAAERASEETAALRRQAQEAAAAHGADAVRMRGELAALEAEGEQAARRLQSLTAEAAALQGAGERREQERAQTEAAGSDQAARPDEVAPSERRAAQARLVGEAAVRLSALEGEEGALREALRGREAALARLRQQGQARRAQLERVEAERVALAATLARLQRELAAARDALAAAAEEGAEEGTLARLAAQEEGRREAVGRAQRSQIGAERALVVMEAAHEETEGACARLREQMRSDEFAIDAEGRVVTGGGGRVPAFMAREEPSGTAPAAGGSGALPAATQSTPAAGGGNGGGQEPGGREPAAGGEEPSLAELRERIETLRGRLRWLGAVNPDAAGEYQEVRERYDYLSGQIADLEGAEQRLLTAEAELAGLIRERFESAFKAVNGQFRHYFQQMFGGGNARLALSDEGDWENSGVEIAAQPPGKRLDNLSMLSGGERSLTAIALLFAMLTVKPAPFCVLDEVDAALDEVNVGRFVGALQALAARTQFVIITHNRRTIEQADSIYGITMGDDSVSRVLSVRLADFDVEADSDREGERDVEGEPAAPAR